MKRHMTKHKRFMIGPAMTVDVTTTINGYQFNRILSAMQND